MSWNRHIRRDLAHFFFDLVFQIGNPYKFLLNLILRLWMWPEPRANLFVSRVYHRHLSFPCIIGLTLLRLGSFPSLLDSLMSPYNYQVSLSLWLGALWSWLGCVVPFELLAALILCANYRLDLSATLGLESKDFGADIAWLGASVGFHLDFGSWREMALLDEDLPLFFWFDWQNYLLGAHELFTGFIVFDFDEQFFSSKGNGSSLRFIIISACTKDSVNFMSLFQCCILHAFIWVFWY